MNKATTSEQEAVAAESAVKNTIAGVSLALTIDDLVRLGERYAGIVLREDGSLSHHLFVLPGDFKGDWNASVAWAKEAGGELPTRDEQAILFGNAKSEFKKDWYWSGTQHAANAACAWGQDFGYGVQNSVGKSASLRARAVRRLPI